MNEARDRVIEEARRRIAALPFAYRELLRDELDRRAPELPVAAAGWCLAAAIALDGNALAQATALALLDLTNVSMAALSFAGVGTPAPLQESWGMPRALNAGDAAFALAQSLATEGVGDASRTLAVASAYDAASRASSVLLLGGDEMGYLRAAARLGATAAGASAAQVESIAAAVDASVKVEEMPALLARSLKGGGS